MTFGERITSIRKRKGISQSELGKQAGTSGDLIGKYERDEVKPSIEVASNIAKALNVSLDFLVGVVDLELDKEILDKIVAIQQLNNTDKQHLLTTIDALLRDAKARQTYG